MFLQKIQDHMPNVLECIFLPSNLIILERQPDFKSYFELNKETLRTSFSKLVGNSFAKAGKKISVEQDIKR